MKTESVKRQSVQEALKNLFKDKKAMERIYKKMILEEESKDNITDRWKRRFDKMDDKTFTSYVKTICGGL